MVKLSIMVPVLLKKKGLVEKTGELKYGEYQPGSQVDTEWTLTLNKAQYEFSGLTIIDVLPGEIVGGVDGITITPQTDSDVGKTLGYSDGVIGDNHQYNFGISSEKYNKNALKLDFDSSYSGKTITVKFTTRNSWSALEGDSFMNYASAFTGSGLYEDTSGKVTVEENIRKNAFKQGTKQLEDKENSTVLWQIGIGTHLDNYFGIGKVDSTDEESKNRIPTVTIDEVLNSGAEHDYLSLPTNKDDYTLYHIDKKNNSVTKGEKIAQANYEIVLDGNGQITINFLNDNDEINAFMVEFETPINFAKWMSDSEVKSVPGKFDFNNKATINYGNVKDLEVEAKLDQTSDGIYLNKESALDNPQGYKIGWNAVINPDAKTLRNMTITDVLTGEHSIITDTDSFKLYKVDKAGISYSEKDGKLIPTVNKNYLDGELVRGEDYDISPIEELDSSGKTQNGFVITIHGKVETPLYLEYETTITGNSSTYSNKISVSSSDYDVESSHEVGVSAGGRRQARSAIFRKVDGINKKIIAGATFKLEELKEVNLDKNNPNNWQAAKNIFGAEIEEVTSDASGYFEFLYLNTSTTYRVVETKAAEEYSSAMEPIILEYNDADNWNKKTQNVENLKIGPTANLTIQKEVENLGKDNQFEFEIRAYNSSDADSVDTNFTGTFETEGSGSSSQKVVFKNGVGTFSLAGDKDLTIKDLPIYVPSKDTQKLSGTTLLGRNPSQKTIQLNTR